MTLEQRIAISLLETKELTISKPMVKPFRDWLIKGGGTCTAAGDVITRKGSKVVFAPSTKKNAFRVSLQEVTA